MKRHLLKTVLAGTFRHFTLSAGAGAGAGAGGERNPRHLCGLKMGVVMDKHLGPAFAEKEHLTYQG